LDAGKLSRNSQLVILSSVWGRVSRPNKLSYGISKAALSGLVRSLAVDLGPIGIQVNAVSPGPVDTPMTIKNLNPEELGRVISEVPLKRLVTLDEVTSLIYELVTGKLSGVNGQEIVVDGGWSVSKLV
jgi:NAD(P)-dependent dehydrogenase (short-subunit alcohol dehydrogenase family)